MNLVDDLIKNSEGGYVNDPDDKGGETYNGISRKWFPDWQGWKIIDTYKKLNVDNLDKILSGNDELSDLVKMFYTEKFITPFDMISDKDIKAELFDTGVNLSVLEAKKILQRSLNLLNRNQKLFNDLIVDGVIGTKTIDAIQKVKKIKLLTVLNGEQYVHYRKIVLTNPTQEKFFAGWMNRVKLK